MTLTRAKATLWVGVPCLLGTIVACSVTIVPEDDGIGGTVTIANKTFGFKLQELDPFSLTADNPPVPQAARIELFEGTPEATPESASITLEAKSVQVIDLLAPKTQASSQTISGTADLDVSIGAYGANPCAEGIYVGSFRLTLSDGSVTIEQVSLTVPSERVEAKSVPSGLTARAQTSSVGKPQ